MRWGVGKRGPEAVLRCPAPVSGIPGSPPGPAPARLGPPAHAVRVEAPEGAAGGRVDRQRAGAAQPLLEPGVTREGNGCQHCLIAQAPLKRTMQ